MFTLAKYRRLAIAPCLGLVVLAVMMNSSQAAGMPEWVSAPPADSAEFLYGIGEGDDRESAKSAALAAIAGTLMTNVRSSFAISQTVSDGRLEEQVKAQVDTQVGNTELSNFQVVEAKKISKRWWVLVQLPRAELIDATRTRLHETDQSLTNAMNRLQQQSVLEQYLNQAPVVAQLEKSRATLALLRAADTEFDGSAYTDRYLGYEDSLASIIRKLEIRVTGDAAAEGFARKLVNLLADERIKASIGTASRDQASIEIRSEIEDFEFGADKESRVQLRLITLSDKGDVVASVERTEVGASLTSNEIAQKQATGKLAREAERQGVFNFLGLNQAR
jgi:hypothetical protein